MKKLIVSSIVVCIYLFSGQIQALTDQQDALIRKFEADYKNCMMKEPGINCIQDYTNNIKNYTSLSDDVCNARKNQWIQDYNYKISSCSGRRTRAESRTRAEQDSCRQAAVGHTGFTLLDDAGLSADKVISEIKNFEYAQRLQSEEDEDLARRFAAADNKFRKIVQEEDERDLAQAIAADEGMSQRTIERTIEDKNVRSIIKRSSIAVFGAAFLWYLFD